MMFLTDAQRLKLVKIFALQAHKSQVDKAGEPYIGHITRVANNCKSTSAKIVGLLHDAVEDGQSSYEELESLGILKESELLAIKLLDKTFMQELEEVVSQDKYYERIKNNPLAREVKIADLKDNLNVTRFIRNGIELTQKHLDRLKKYEERLSLLSED